MTLPATRREDEIPHVTDLDAETLSKLVLGGDCSRLNDVQRVAYYRARCEAAGLDYRTQPFEFLKLNGKEILYARKEASAQLASKHGIRCEITDQRTEQDMRVVTVRAATKDGRQTDEIGVVNIANKKGDDLANALMKCVTKAKRRAVLSVCGLGELDETELETIRGAQPMEGGAPPALVAPRRKSEQKPLDHIGGYLGGCAHCGTVFTDPDVAAAHDCKPMDPDSILIAGEPEPADAGRVLTQKEIGSLMGVVKKSKRTPEEFVAWVKERFGIASRKEIRFGWLDQITAWLAAAED